MKKRGRKRINLTGQKFNKLTVIKIAYIKKRKTYWICKCDCGNDNHIVEGSHLKNGSVKNCGCSHFSHRLSKTRFYKIWAGMKTRCFNKNVKAYKFYGAKGITVCKEWLDFNNFKTDMYKSYLQNCKICGKKNTTLDRINPKKNYKLNNCRWATITEQNNNKKFILVKKDYLDKLLTLNHL